MHFYLILLLLVNISLSVSGLRILGLFPHPGKSHVDVFVPLMRALAEKGHDVTVVSNFPLENPPKSYRDINLADVLKPRININNVMNSVRIYHKFLEVFDLKSIHEITYEAALKSDIMQNFIKSSEKFDVIIAELFNSDSFMAFAYRFDAPVVGLSSCTIMPWTSDRFANPTNPSYIPNNHLAFSDRMTFFERVLNFVGQIEMNLVYKSLFYQDDNRIVKQYFGNDYPDLDAIIANYSSILLVNSHYSLNLPRPLVPAVVEIGGIHVKAAAKKLPNVSK